MPSFLASAVLRRTVRLKGYKQRILVCPNHSALLRPESFHASVARYSTAPVFRSRWKDSIKRAIGLFAGTGAGFLVYQAWKNEGPLLLDSTGSRWLGQSEKIERPKYAPVMGPLTEDEAEALLRQGEVSTMLCPGVRLDHNSIASNEPGEDNSAVLMRDVDSESEVDVDPSHRSKVMAAIFDGHAGPTTSLTLSVYLMHYILSNLEDKPYSGRVDDAIKNAFVQLDQDILNLATRAVQEPRYLPDAIAETAAAYAGSCALLSLFDYKTKELKVACTGDSRAVLGRQDASGRWTAIPLSIDQTGHNEQEVARLEASHPGEPEMLRDGRLLGLAVTRAFGDARWKWPRDIQEKAHERLYGPKLREPLISPPYLTAEPVITTTNIKPENGDFLIMASDGLWDVLSNDQAVQLVVRWAKLNDVQQAISPRPLPTVAPKLYTPFELSQKEKPKANVAYTKGPEVSESDYVYKDTNAATHLARHALGGGNVEWLVGLITGRAPHSRNMRDDITVEVLFFGQHEEDADDI